jgi:hypothetical protein
VPSINIPVKTPEGVDELGSRQRKLGQRHRTVLLLVDGRRRESQVRQLAVQAGVPDQIFDELVAMGLIMFTQGTGSMQGNSGMAPLDVDLPLDTVSGPLPPSLSLQPESVLTDSMVGDLPISDLAPLDEADAALDEARAILMRAVKAEAPVAGSLTLMRLKRARSRNDIEALLDEVEQRITKPFKGIWAAQTIARVRELLRTVNSPSAA